MAHEADFLAGDVVSVNVPNYGKREGLVIGTYNDQAGRQIVEIRFDQGHSHDHYHAWHPLVTRVRRYAGWPNSYPYYYTPQRTLERHVHYY